MIQILSNYGDLLLRAMGQTLLLALCGLLFGTLLGMTYPPEEGAQRVLVATLYDGTDTLELRWPGRSSIPGLSVGQRLEVEGTVGRVGERLVIINR